MGWKRRFFWAALFGMLPDLLAFGPFFIYRMLSGTFVWGRPEVSSIPGAVFMAYNFSHSLFTAAVMWLLIRYAVSKELTLAAWAYPLHILLDIPTHDRSFFPTPFLYPLLDVKVDGISWANPYFMIFNYTALLTVYFFYFRARAKRRGIKTPNQPI